jgi:hypothetical protein
VKLMLAAGSGRLDLTDCRLERLPPGVLELTELEVSDRRHRFLFRFVALFRFLSVWFPDTRIEVWCAARRDEQ